MKNKVISIVFSGLCGFIIGLGLHHGYAKYVNPELYMGPKVENVQNLQDGVSCQEYWYEGRKYLIFTSEHSSMQVIRQ